MRLPDFPTVGDVAFSCNQNFLLFFINGRRVSLKDWLYHCREADMPPGQYANACIKEVSQGQYDLLSEMFPLD
jgi:hypothetical protein